MGKPVKRKMNEVWVKNLAKKYHWHCAGYLEKASTPTLRFVKLINRKLLKVDVYMNTGTIRLEPEPKPHKYPVRHYRLCADNDDFELLFRTGNASMYTGYYVTKSEKKLLSQFPNRMLPRNAEKVDP